MGKKRMRRITDGKLPNRMCPVCSGQVVKVLIYGQLSWLCNAEGLWGPWDDAPKKPLASSAPSDL